MTDTDERRIDVLSYGESLVDFLPESSGVPLRDVESFRRVVGGAPTNLALGLARLGCRAGLLGKVGTEEFGEFVVRALRRAGVDTRGVARTDRAQTGLTFVTLDEEGDRSFLFYRKKSADMLIRCEDVDPSLVREAGVVQIGSNLMAESEVREATLRMLECAEEHDRIVSFDPNIRLHKWESAEAARRAVLEMAESADIVKVNEEELDLLADGAELDEAWRQLFEPRGVTALALTLAGHGASLRTSTGRIDVGAPDVDVVDTTGAGDGFLAGFLAGLGSRLRAEAPDEPGRWSTLLEGWRADRWRPLLELGCFVGSRVCTELGATPPLPERRELPESLQSHLE